MENKSSIRIHIDRIFGASARKKEPEAMEFLHRLSPGLSTPEESERRNLQGIVELLNMSPLRPIEEVRRQLKELVIRIYDVDFEQAIIGADSHETYAADTTVAGGELLERIDSLFGRIEVRDGKYFLK